MEEINDKEKLHLAQNNYSHFATTEITDAKNQNTSTNQPTSKQSKHPLQNQPFQFKIKMCRNKNHK